MDWFLLVSCIIMAILLIFVNVYLLVVYCHPDDKGFGVSWFCKGLVVLGLTLCWAQVLILPLDVANSRTGGGFNMAVFWQIIYIVLFIFAVVLIPFAMFFYETDEERSFINRILTALCFDAITVIIVCAAIAITWSFLRFANIPVEGCSRGLGELIPSSSINEMSGIQNNSSESLQISVSIIIYMICFVAFFGWFLFALFAGVGLIALPMDFALSWKNRPIVRSAQELAEKKIGLRRQATELIKQTRLVQDDEIDLKQTKGFFAKWKPKAKFSKKFNHLKKEIILLEQEFELYNIEINLPKSNPLVYLGKTILGGVLAVVSLMIWIHILLYVLIKPGGVPLYPFLNNFLILLEEKMAGFFATILFAFIGLYMLWCVIKGNMKIGLRLLIIFLPIHPMKVNGTWMNSFLFNVMLIMITSVACVQFSSIAFSLFTRLTTVEIMFGVQIKYMRFFKYFFQYDVFFYIMMVWTLVVLVYLIIRPQERLDYRKLIDEKRKKMGK